MRPISHTTAKSIVEQALPMLGQALTTRTQRIVNGTNLPATPANTFRHMGYTPELLLDPHGLPSEQRQINQLRGMYQPIFILNHVQDNLLRVETEYKPRQANKRFLKTAKAILHNYFSFILSGPSMKRFETDMHAAREALAHATSPKDRHIAQAALDRAFNTATRATRYFEDIDEIQARLFADFDRARYGTMNLNYSRFPTPEACRFYSEIISLTVEVQISCKFTTFNLGIDLDPQQENLYLHMARWSRHLLGDKLPTDAENTYWNSVYSAYIRKLNQYIRPEILE